MLLVDISQVMISNVMMHLKPAENIEEKLIRHMILSSLVSYRKKFSSEYGNLIICCDDKDYWRKDIFPYYKASRKKDREISSIDWNALFIIMHKIKQEIKEFLPYKTIQVPRVEADDIIATICHRYGTTDPNDKLVESILIISGDKDFVQLQKYRNVEQYNPIQKKKIITDNPERVLREHILIGDRGDGIPNILTEDTVFVNNLRQRPLSRKKIEEWITKEPNEFCSSEMLRNYHRNELLVNLDLIPHHIQEDIWNQFETVEIPPRSGILNYLMQHRLRELTSRLSDF